MRYTENIKRLVRKSYLKNLHMPAGAQMDERILNDALAAMEDSKKARPVLAGPNIGRIIMKSRITKLAAAAVIIVAVVLSINVWDKSTPSAYAFEQTVEAMQSKRSFHIQTYFQNHRKDEFWAEFNENGKVIRYRQEEEEGFYGPIVTLWEDHIRFKYYPKPDNICLITNTIQTEPELEEFDPETAAQEIYEQVAKGKSTIEIQEPSSYEGLITINVTHTERFHRQVLLVDPDTKFVTRVDNYFWDADEEQEFHKGIEVLEYNQTIDPNMFSPNFPEDTLTLDQVSQEVGMTQGQMTDEEVAIIIVSEALEAWAAADYAKAGKLFGGAPTELLTELYGHLRPVNAISVGQPLLIEYRKPWFEVPCIYEVVRDGQIKTIEPTLNALAVDGQPGRWYVSIERNP